MYASSFWYKNNSAVFYSDPFWTVQDRKKYLFYFKEKNVWYKDGQSWMKVKKIKHAMKFLKVMENSFKVSTIRRNSLSYSSQIVPNKQEDLYSNYLPKIHLCSEKTLDICTVRLFKEDYLLLNIINIRKNQFPGIYTTLLNFSKNPFLCQHSF